MLEIVLPAYLEADSTITDLVPQIYRDTVPQGITPPYIVIGGCREADPGNVSASDRPIGNLLATYSLIIVSELSLAEIDTVAQLISRKLKVIRNIWLPNDTAVPRLYLQGLTVTGPRRFDYVPPRDGDETPYKGYIFELRASTNNLVTS